MSQRRTVLLVEDNRAEARLIQESLRDEHINLSLHHVLDGEQALDFLHRRGAHIGAPRPELVLLDLNVPKRSGRDVLCEIKRTPGLCAIPVVVLTTSDRDEDVSWCYAHHCNAYISKPLGFRELGAVLRKLMAFWFEATTLLR